MSTASRSYRRFRLRALSCAIALASFLMGVLRHAIDKLPRDERDLIRSKYFHGESLTEFGRREGRDKYWASRLHKKALDNLARSMECSGIT